MSNDCQEFALQVNIHISQSGDKRRAERNGICEYLQAHTTHDFLFNANHRPEKKQRGMATEKH